MREEINKNEPTLATEILQELKEQNRRQDIVNKRQHIIIIVLILVIISMIIGFFIFINQFEIVEDDTEQVMEDIDGNNSTYTQTIN
jgi:hypothetical protein